MGMLIDHGIDCDGHGGRGLGLALESARLDLGLALGSDVWVAGSVLGKAMACPLFM